MPSTTKVLSLLAAAASVAAHGTVTGIVADGVYYEGYLLDFQYEATEPITVGWLIPEDTDNGFVAPDAYASDDIICHVGATNAMTAAAVSAGGTVEFQWTVWPDSHKGPVITYLANCNGACETVDKTTLEWFKIDAGGLIDDTTIPGTWASDTLIANNNSWTVEIPPTLATGNYVARHEIIALHSAENSDGAQNYPFCVNLAVTGTGSDAPTGVLGTDLYTETDAGILVNIYASLATYEIPGPTLWSGAVSVSQTTPAAPTASATGISSVEAGSGAATTAAASSAAATTAAASSAAVTSAAASSAAATSAAASSPAATSAAASSVAASSSVAVSSAPAVATSAPASTFVTSVAAASSSSGSTACKRKRAAQQL